MKKKVKSVTTNMSVKMKGCPKCLIAIPMHELIDGDDWNFCPKCGGTFYRVDADPDEGEEI
jgi:ribosomal protein S27AE